MSYLRLSSYTNMHTFFSHPMSLVMMTLLPALLTACGGPLVGVTVVDERTALENQVLGTYQELNQQVMLVASVRYIDPKGKLKQTQELPPGKKDVVRALQRVSFNKDDLNRYKSLGIIGENNEGGVTLLEPEKVQPDDRAFVENLIKEENEDRLAIMGRIVETNETLTPSELPRVHKMFAALNRDKALKGERIQLDNGTWTQKDATP
ncbi:DUF1318 domain-containing protein [Candidatus Nitrospira neomarina]|uniref:DUF1318 domain-containing protein n=1 Tax=Candidatus Nitrospira neomarina TaxID=3020899 RepID=A0AA96GHR2_9BACT|nr:DUF1318 domain-containing protein [Candidatus Nitrospira neomarina]WNM60505.1 DUF1318 domain-containing protein [Candidatus Nitrospira neomarina]